MHNRVKSADFEQYARTCVRRAIKYFKDKFEGDDMGRDAPLKTAMDIFCSARVCDPTVMINMSIEEIRTHLSFLCSIIPRERINEDELMEELEGTQIDSKYHCCYLFWNHLLFTCIILFVLSGLLRYLRQGDNAELPKITPEDVDAPKQSVRKFSGEDFQDRDEQISSKAFRVQKWWNQKKSSRSLFKRYEYYRNFGVLVTHLALFQPSSAASERVFSILQKFFSDGQTSCLQDLKETTCKLVYNNRKP